MKRNTIFILIMCLLASLVSCITPYDDSRYDGPVHEGPIEPIIKVIEVPNTSKDELYILANDWLTNVAEGAIEFTDKEAGISKVKITIPNIPMGKSFIDIYGPVAVFEYGTTVSSLKVEVKDNKARITIDYIDTSSDEDGHSVGTRIYELGYTNYIKKCNAKIEDFNTFLSSHNSNW